VNQFERNDRLATSVRSARLEISLGTAAATNAQNFAEATRDD
jgi:hypothetical protein